MAVEKNEARGELLGVWNRMKQFILHIFYVTQFSYFSPAILIVWNFRDGRH